MELEIELLAAKRLGKIREMSFYFSVFPAKGGASSQIDRGGSLPTIWQDGLTGVHAVGRQALVLGGEISGGKTEALTATLSAFDLAEDGERATQHSGCFRQVSCLDGGTDPAATNSFPLIEDRFGIIQGN